MVTKAARKALHKQIARKARQVGPHLYPARLPLFLSYPTSITGPPFTSRHPTSIIEDPRRKTTTDLDLGDRSSRSGPRVLRKAPRARVHISFVRSVTMDSRSEIQLKKMEAGGNNKLNAFLTHYGIAKETDTVKKYNTNTASMYHDRIQRRKKKSKDADML